MHDPQVRAKARTSLLWLGMISMAMAFAGLTSGYVVSRSALQAENMWMVFDVPGVFMASTVALVLSSAMLLWANRKRIAGNYRAAALFTGFGLLLGTAFATMQGLGFLNLLARGIYFTGPGSSTSASWFYVIVGFHFLHFMAGWITLMVVWFKAQTGKYSTGSDLGMRLGFTFWHFLGVLWLYLYAFLLIIR